MMQRLQMDYLRERMRREEIRARAFLERTGLPISEATMVLLPSGNAYPQWKGALIDKPALCGGED